MGLLDSLGYGNQGGYGGLLDALMYQNPTSQGFEPPLSPIEQQMMRMTGPNQPYSGLGPNFAPPQPQDPIAAPQPTSSPQAGPIAVGDYQMPRIGDAGQFQPSQAMLPPNAQPAQGQLPPQMQAPQAPQQAPPQAPPQELPPAFGGTSYLERLNNGGGLIGSLLGDTTQQKNLTAQYQAIRQTLVANGENPQTAASKAMIAVMNPKASETILPELFTSKTEIKMVKDALGAEHPYSWNPRDQTFKPVGATGEGGGIGGIGGIGAPQVLAAGVAKYDPSLTGEQYINQFGPEVKAAIKAQINGDVMPTGNPRLQAIASVSKTFATKYAQDMGIPFSDALYAEKRKLKTDLASSNNSSLGGILSNGESSFAHLAEAGQSMADLGNTSHNFPLGGYIAHGQNYIGNTLGGSDTQGKVKALNNNLGRYGQESTKFYAGSGGGVEERTAARKEMNAETTSGEEYASYLEKEKSLMLDRLKSKFDQIRQTLGEEEAQRVIAKHTPDIQKNVEKIDASIAKLRGEQAAPAAAKSSGLPSGWSVKVN